MGGRADGQIDGFRGAASGGNGGNCLCAPAKGGARGCATTLSKHPSVVVPSHVFAATSLCFLKVC